MFYHLKRITVENEILLAEPKERNPASFTIGFAELLDLQANKRDLTASGDGSFEKIGHLMSQLSKA